MSKHVQIEIVRGVATVTEKPEGITLTILNYDMRDFLNNPALPTEDTWKKDDIIGPDVQPPRTPQQRLQDPD